MEKLALAASYSLRTLLKDQARSYIRFHESFVKFCWNSLPLAPSKFVPASRWAFFCVARFAPTSKRMHRWWPLFPALLNVQDLVDLLGQFTLAGAAGGYPVGSVSLADVAGAGAGAGGTVSLIGGSGCGRPRGSAGSVRSSSSLLKPAWWSA